MKLISHTQIDFPLRNKLLYAQSVVFYVFHIFSLKSDFPR